ncbi:hypothetical protein BS47DRAFT_1443001 [Hydnum rufescens UP504]|uniref:60S ribosomal protein L36 n=1 Tax=Hydnum rufescens UP504 TaxID=1448309 RepID=A0A9P6AE37_9AGAM|nr:hypothetical protein BS47DRAFT_1443001 [Hydnum rufescens UP504]
MAVLYVDLRVGTNKGHPTTPIKKAAKGIQSPKQKLVQSIVHEVASYAPYKHWVMELLQNSKDKKAQKLTKKRLLCSKHKLEELSTITVESHHAH